MSRRPILTSITVRNFLSIRALERLELGTLNVLVGPNGAGKSNLLKVFRFLGEVARVELPAAIEHMGGMDRLRYQGAGAISREVEISLTGRITAYASDQAPDEYTLAFREGMLPSKHRYLSRREIILFKRKRGVGRRITVEGGNFEVFDDRQGSKRDELKLQKTATALGTVRRLGEAYEAPSLEALADIMEDMRLIDINVDQARAPAVLETIETLEPDAHNIAAYLMHLRAKHVDAFEAVEEDMRFVLPSFSQFTFTTRSEDDFELNILERDRRKPIPLTSASFGTVRAIALFAMLNDPNPPALTCIEEIDTGLHPHALDRVVDRLRDAASRSQIIVATHSPALVNRLATHELIVAERNEETGESEFKRPEPLMVERLRERLGYELGEMWFSGSFGGNP